MFPLFFRLLLPLCALGLSTAALADHNSANSTQIRVTLFGQPCALEGPFSQATLKSIHAISPEQIFPDSASGEAKTKPQIKSALQKLRANSVPPQLDRYKQLFDKRLQALLEYFDAIDEYKISHKLDTLYAVEKRNVLITKQKDFEVLMKKFESSPGTALFESYSASIEPEPEEEFHRAILKASVQYNCSFEEKNSDN